MKPTRFELVALLVAAGIVAYQIFNPPLIGMADNGDFERYLPQIGLAHLSKERSDNYFAYFNSRYRILKKSAGDIKYKSSTVIPVRAARWISLIAGHSQIFDIRILAALYTSILLLGIWLILVATRSLGSWLRLILCSLLIMIFTDAGYVAYFNSFYSEATAFSFLAIALGSALILIAGSVSSFPPLIGYFVASAVVVTAKPQYLPIAPAMMLFGIWLSRYLRVSWRYLLSCGLALALGCVAVWYYTKIPKDLVESPYVGIFMDLLPNSPSPREDLSAMGLNPELVAYSGTTPYQSESPLSVPGFRPEFAAKVNAMTLPSFYVTHPGRFHGLLVRSMKHTFSTRLRYFGYFEASTGKPPFSQPVGIWSSVRENVFPRHWLFLGFFFATGIAAALLIKSASKTQRSMFVLYVLCMFIAVVQFLVPVVAEGGPDLQKHLFMFNLAFDVCLVLLVLCAMFRFQTLRAHLLVSLKKTGT